MGQSRLTSLAIIHIERELSEKVSIDKVIDKFATVKNSDKK